MSGNLSTVMAGLDPAIYAVPRCQDVDARDEPGHDAESHSPPKKRNDAGSAAA